MQIETHGQQIEVTPALRDYVETRFERLARHFEHPWGQNSIIATLPGKSEKTVVIGAVSDARAWSRGTCANILPAPGLHQLVLPFSPCCTRW